MENLEIHIFHETDDGLWRNPGVYQLSDFGGRLPTMGDWIIDPAIGPSSRNILTEQTMLGVVRYCYNPHRPDRIAMIVSERSPSEDQQEVMSALFDNPRSR